MSAREIDAWFTALRTLLGVDRATFAELGPREVQRRIRARMS